MTRCGIRVGASLTPTKGRHEAFLLVLTILGAVLLRTEQARMPHSLSVEYSRTVRRRILDMPETCPPSSTVHTAESEHDLEVLHLFPRDSKGFLVAYCASFNKSCGKKAAKEYCKEMGFQNAVAWEAFEKAGQLCGQTRYISEPQRICSGQSCKGFTFISCSQEQKEK